MLTKEEIVKIISDDIKEYMAPKGLACNTHEKALEILEKVEPFQYNTYISGLQSVLGSFKSWAKYDQKVYVRLTMKFKQEISAKRFSNKKDYLFDSLLKSHINFMELIAKTIDYGQSESWVVQDYFVDKKWSVDGANLTIFENDENGEDFYEFTISSYSALGQKLFTGTIGVYTLFLGYPEHLSYDNSEILILKTENRI